jgi:hypothetical protein
MRTGYVNQLSDMLQYKAVLARQAYLSLPVKNLRNIFFSSRVRSLFTICSNTAAAAAAAHQLSMCSFQISRRHPHAKQGLLSAHTPPVRLQQAQLVRY